MKNIEKIFALIISGIILFLSVFFFINEKKVFSENENRYLAKTPKYNFEALKSGRYMTQIENYLIDHFPLRDDMVSLKTNTYKIVGIREVNNIYLGSDGYLLEEFKELTNIDKIVSTINKLQEKLDFKLDVMLVPTSTDINSDKLPKYAINKSEKEEINKFYNMLNTNKINVYDSLYNNKDKYQLYYKLDHHWTSFGAYVAYLNYCEYKNITPITDYNIKEVSNSFYGTFYSKTNDYSLKADSINIFEVDNPDYTVVYEDKTVNSLYATEYLDKKDKYSYFLDNNHSLITITNNNLDNEQKILIIKDSYANSFVPFIVNNYKYVYVIDPRYYKSEISSFIKDNEISNVLFLYNAGTINNDLGIVSVK